MERESERNLNDGIKKEESRLFGITTYRNFKFKELIENGAYEKVVRYMYRPTDPSSLGVIRFLFGK